jgi:hypothetical protein
MRVCIGTSVIVVVVSVSKNEEDTPRNARAAGRNTIGAFRSIFSSLALTQPTTQNTMDARNARLMPLRMHGIRRIVRFPK